MDDALLASLEEAVRNAPDQTALRLHVAGLLLDRGQVDRAMPHIAHVLAADPTSAPGRALMARALTSTDDVPFPVEKAAPRQAPEDQRSGPAAPDRAREVADFDWSQAERQVEGLVPPMFAEAGETPATAGLNADGSRLRLDDVAGMSDVKARLEASFLAPLRNPELRALYRKSLRGGLLLYGPPGCGKTFIARAVAGELGAAFITVSLADILDMWVGNSEKNVRDLFERARAAAPCVVFLDELDAIGQKRALSRNTGARTTVNQLLMELDGVASSNEGVFVLGASNHPWDVDPALLRPGRFDRKLLVLPPDEAARAAIIRFHLRDRPVDSIDPADIARRTAGFSGADLAHVCESAAEEALLSSVSAGAPRLIGMADLRAAAASVRPSTTAWLDMARNVVTYANPDGEYDDLARYIRRGRS
ncbi:ATP-binding protein [Intrasporangium sp. YIM S08009]|uniref:ATP-binding protein n=1 Tax=Intrasporangium zincisolvens TaxID=3080018 RepID=UPI002B05882A|nr:AAA family ATPase [Intrasporangium sp. YIM S08009]